MCPRVPVRLVDKAAKAWWRYGVCQNVHRSSVRESLQSHPGFCLYLCFSYSEWNKRVICGWLRRLNFTCRRGCSKPFDKEIIKPVYRKQHNPIYTAKYHEIPAKREHLLCPASDKISHKQEPQCALHTHAQRAPRLCHKLLIRYTPDRIGETQYVDCRQCRQRLGEQ